MVDRVAVDPAQFNVSHRHSQSQDPQRSVEIRPGKGSNVSGRGLDGALQLGSKGVNGGERKKAQGASERAEGWDEPIR